MNSRSPGWKYWLGALPAIIFVLSIGIFPQIDLKIHRGDDYNGSIAFYDSDEPAYAVYAKSLASGKPRKNSPYLGNQPIVSESLFSIQVLPAYAIAAVSRISGMPISLAFLIVSLLCISVSAFTAYLLLLQTTRDWLTAVAGSLAMFSFGTLLSGQGALKSITGLGYPTVYFPFTRRYMPSFGFPFMLAFFYLVYRGFVSRSVRTKLFAFSIAGIVFNILIYSYFYLWSTCLAWLILFTILSCFFQERDSFKTNLQFLLGLILFCSVSLAPYFFLVSDMDTRSGQVLLESVRKPVLLNPHLGAAYIAIIIAIVAFLFGKAKSRRTEFFLALSFILLPFVVFNQQLITGHSLQSFHYGRFVSNYTLSIGVVICLWLILLRWRDKVFTKVLLLLLIPVAVSWGMVEIIYQRPYGIRHSVGYDKAVPVNEHLAWLASTPAGNDAVTLNLDLEQAETQSVYAPQPLIWTRHIRAFAGVTKSENQNRLFKFLYFSDVQPSEFDQRIRNCRDIYLCVWFFSGYAMATHSIEKGSPSPEDFDELVEQYKTFHSSFAEREAYNPRISYLILPGKRREKTTNIDRWYRKTETKKFQNHIFYELNKR